MFLVALLALRHLGMLTHDARPATLPYAALLGANVGSKLTPLGSLATLLWLDMLARRGCASAGGATRDWRSADRGGAAGGALRAGALRAPVPLIHFAVAVVVGCSPVRRVATAVVLACAVACLPSSARAHEPDEVDHAPDSAPVVVNQVEATYPPQARAAGLSGTVALELTVDSDGNVSDVKVTRGAGFGFDESAVAAARALKFRPAMHDGKAIAATVAFEQRFTLRPHVIAETTAEGGEGAASNGLPMATTSAVAPAYESTVSTRGPVTAASSSTIPQPRLRPAPARPRRTTSCAWCPAS